MKTDVLIIGGGLSGLALADRLHRAGTAFHLVEARSRLGGRIKVLRDETAAFDLGPSWFWPGQPLMDGLTKRLGLRVFAQYAEGALCYEDEKGTVHKGMGYASMQGALRVEGGMAAIIDALASTLPKGSVQLNTPVKKIAERAATLADGTIVEAETLVLAVPPRVVAEMEISADWGNLKRPLLQNIQTWMAGQAKFVATYDTAFWRDAGLSGDMSSRHGPLVEVHDASPAAGGPYALFGFVGVPFAVRGGQEAAVKDAALAQLARAFGSPALHPRKVVLQDWASEPETSTLRDHAPPTHHPAYGLPRELANLSDGRIRLASTEVAPEFGGFLEGALSIAQSLAAELTCKS